MSLNNEEFLTRSSVFSKSFQTGLCETIKLIAGSIMIKDGVISGIERVLGPNDIIPKSFADTLYDVNKSVNNIRSDENIFISPRQVLNGFIVREIPDNTSKTDIYPTGLEIKEQIGILNLKKFETIIYNSSTVSLFIDFDRDNINCLNENKQPEINSNSLMKIINIVEENRITINYYLNYSFQIPQQMFELENYFSFGNKLIRQGSKSCKSINTFSITTDSNITYTPEQIVNSFIRRDDETFPFITDQFPSNIEILNYLGIEPQFLTSNYSFRCDLSLALEEEYKINMGSGMSLDIGSSDNPNVLTLVPLVLFISLIFVFDNTGQITVILSRRGDFEVII